MDPTNIALVQLLSLSGLVGASGAYAGIVRRRHERRMEAETAARSSDVAVERVARHRALTGIENTFARSAYPHRKPPSAGPRD